MFPISSVVQCPSCHSPWSCPAEVQTGDLGWAGNGKAHRENLGIGCTGVQKPMPVVRRPQPADCNSMKRNLVAAVNELLQTSAGGWALCNSLPSHSSVSYSKPKPDLVTPTAEDADSFAWNVWNVTVLFQCAFPMPLLFSHPYLQGYGRVGRCWDTPCLVCSCGLPSASWSLWLGCPFSSAGLQGLYFLLNVCVSSSLTPSSWFRYYFDSFIVALIFLYPIYNSHTHMYVYLVFGSHSLTNLWMSVSVLNAWKVPYTSLYA